MPWIFHLFLTLFIFSINQSLAYNVAISIAGASNAQQPNKFDQDDLRVSIRLRRRGEPSQPGSLTPDLRGGGQQGRPTSQLSMVQSVPGFYRLSDSIYGKGERTKDRSPSPSTPESPRTRISSPDGKQSGPGSPGMDWKYLLHNGPTRFSSPSTASPSGRTDGSSKSAGSLKQSSEDEGTQHKDTPHKISMKEEKLTADLHPEEVRLLLQRYKSSMRAAKSRGEPAIGPPTDLQEKDRIRRERNRLLKQHERIRKRTGVNDAEISKRLKALSQRPRRPPPVKQEAIQAQPTTGRTNKKLTIKNAPTSKTRRIANDKPIPKPPRTTEKRTPVNPVKNTETSGRITRSNAESLAGKRARPIYYESSAESTSHSKSPTPQASDESFTPKRSHKRLKPKPIPLTTKTRSQKTPWSGTVVSMLDQQSQFHTMQIPPPPITSRQQPQTSTKPTRSALITTPAQNIERGKPRSRRRNRNDRSPSPNISLNTPFSGAIAALPFHDTSPSPSPLPAPAPSPGPSQLHPLLHLPQPKSRTQSPLGSDLIGFLGGNLNRKPSWETPSWEKPVVSPSSLAGGGRAGRVAGAGAGAGVVVGGGGATGRSNVWRGGSDSRSWSVDNNKKGSGIGSPSGSVYSPSKSESESEPEISSLSQR